MSWDHGGKTTTARGYGWAWQKQRLRILARDRHLCQTCKTKGRITPATQVDHVKPKASGGTDDDANLSSICDDCHDAKSAQEAAEAQGRTLSRRQAIGEDGWPVEREASQRRPQRR